MPLRAVYNRAMIEALLVLTLIAACASAGFVALLLLRERGAREELSRGLMGFSQMHSSQIEQVR